MHTPPIIAIIGEGLAVAGLLQRMINRAVPAATVLIVPEVAALPAGCALAVAFLRASPYYLAGFDNLWTLRASAPHAVCIGLTSTPEETTPAAHRAGAHHILAKPFTSVTVRELLTLALAQPEPSACSARISQTRALPTALVLEAGVQVVPLV